MTPNAVSVRLLGELPSKLWGLDLREWQRRAWTKAGAAGVDQAESRLLAGLEWVLSPSLQRNLLAQPGAALLAPAVDNTGEQLVAIHLPEAADASTFLALFENPVADRETLKSAGLTPGGMHDFADAYNKSLRKREVPYVLSMRTEKAIDIERVLFKGSYKGVTDLVTKYAWPVPAFHITRLCAFLRISPNTVTTASLAFVILAFWLFWNGAWAAGLAAAWIMTFLDTVDGKLARTTMTYSNWGNIYDHGIDLIHPPFWYWAIFVGLQGTDDGPSQTLLAGSLAMILAGYLLNRLEEGEFIRRFGFHIHVWQPIDSFMREITARRNPNMLIFMAAVMLGQPGWGFIAIGVWTFICLLFHGGRLVQAMAQKSKPASWLEA
ncbi:putative phosphatidyltransferase [Hyphomonas polymorpha PS728]|uniref:Putative phosphatidyltransferase n=1 Tax=Hyphomonas polymorpha PS728 TaxID=1280954 RepID=A0A062VAS8_9PROT|nr:CDP-alcohol phosphatidyltransferase family protein [Hyphomonas polymorpha]KCZ99438.1 putative phosphatidyltransferase [Hyphomonas polymorpha PS728]